MGGVWSWLLLVVPSRAVRTTGVVASWRWCWVVVLVELGWVRVEIGRARSRTMPTAVHRWRLLVIRRWPGSLMSVIRHRCQCRVKCKKAASDLAQITVPNISGCSCVLSTRVSTRKERIYEPGEWRWWRSVKENVKRFLDAAQQ